MLHRLREAQLGQASLHHPPPGWSSTLVRRLRQERTLEGHDGCVNTVHFSPCGQLLVSGSDDMQVMFWDWQLGTRLLTFHSGHHNNVFQARIMPHSANATVVTCAADGLVRVAHVPQGAGGAAVETRRLACHRGRAHKLSLEPDSPHCFLSCGEDGEVRHFDLREPAAANRRLLACRTQHGRLELNSVHCHPGTTQFCVAGGDPFVRIYDLRRVPPTSTAAPVAEPLHRLAPWHLRGRRCTVTVTCAVFSRSGRVLASYNDENIYTFLSEQEQAAQQQALAAASGKEAGDSGRKASSAVAAETQEARQRGGRAGRGGPAKRGRSSSSRGMESDEGAPARRGAAARPRSGQRHAAAAAALAEAQMQRAAPGAAAAAQAHASMRRRLLDAEEEEAGGSEEAPPAPAPGRRTAQQQQQQQQQQQGREGGQAAAATPPERANGRRGAADASIEARRKHSMSSSGGSSEGERAECSEPCSDWEELADADHPDGGDPASGGSGRGTDLPECSGSGRDGEEEIEASEEEGDLWEEMRDGFEAGLLRDDDDATEVGEEEASEDEGEGEEEGSDSDGFEGVVDTSDGERGRPLGALVDDDEPAVTRGGGDAVAAAAVSSHEGQQSDFVAQAFKGHRNYRTVKGVSYLGQRDEFVMSGSDCGHVYVWDAATGEALAVLQGDADTVNCLEPHPAHLLTIATSGIEDTIKLWTPSAEEPQVLGPAERRLMEANQRAQGEERRMFISPLMLRMMLRARGMLPGDDSDGDGGDGGDGSDGEGSGGDGERQFRPADCTIS